MCFHDGNGQHTSRVCEAQAHTYSEFLSLCYHLCEFDYSTFHVGVWPTIESYSAEPTGKIQNFNKQHSSVQTLRLKLGKESKGRAVYNPKPHMA